MTCDYAKKTGVPVCKIPPEVKKAAQPVREQSAMDDQETDELLKGAVAVMQEVQRVKPETGKSYSMDCPFCASVDAMTYALSTLNNHLHARCSVCSAAVIQ